MEKTLRRTEENEETGRCNTGNSERKNRFLYVTSYHQSSFPGPQFAWNQGHDQDGKRPTLQSLFNDVGGSEIMIE